ncbi:MAG: sigma-70 family RNA polymerase sigma factor [Chloroflexota bacterium]
MDPVLVERARSGDAPAFDALARAAADRLMAIAYRILRDAPAAEDAVQSTLFTAWRELPGLRDPDRFEPWLHRILVNACYAESKRSRHRHEVELLPAHEPTGPDDLLTVAHRDQLERGFRRLSPEHRAVLVFHHELGLPLADIAEHLGVPVGTVKSRLHHALSGLRAALDADDRFPTASSKPRERTA